MPKIDMDIDREVFDKFKEHVQKEDYDSVEDYLNQILEVVGEELEDLEESREDEQSEEEKVKSRLRQLGYLE